MLRQALPLAFACTLGLGWARDAAAQDYRSVPIGGRTATMGGAGIAAGNDSAMPYLNPAGLAGVPAGVLALSATVYGYTRREHERLFYPSGVAGDGVVSRKETSSSQSTFEIPSSIVYFQPLDDPEARLGRVVGFGLVIPEAAETDLVASSELEYSDPDVATFNVENRQQLTLKNGRRVFYLGPTYAMRWGERLRFGISLFAQYETSFASFAYGSRTTTAGGAYVVEKSLETSDKSHAWSFVGVAGAQVEVVPHVWLGAVVQVPGLPLDGRSTGNAAYAASDLNDQGVPVDTSSSGVHDYVYAVPTPLRLGVGVAYEDRERFSVAADLHYHAAGPMAQVDGYDDVYETQTGDLPRRYTVHTDSESHRQHVVNLSIGVEVPLTPLLAVQGGVFTNNSYLPPLKSSWAAITRLDRVGGTAGLGVRLGAVETTFGGLLAFGHGRFGAMSSYADGATAVPVPTREVTVMALVSGSISTEEAKQKIKEAVPFEFTSPDLPSGAPEAPANHEQGAGVRVAPTGATVTSAPSSSATSPSAPPPGQTQVEPSPEPPVPAPAAEGATP